MKRFLGKSKSRTKDEEEEKSARVNDNGNPYMTYQAPARNTANPYAVGTSQYNSLPAAAITNSSSSSSSLSSSAFPTNPYASQSQADVYGGNRGQPAVNDNNSNNNPYLSVNQSNPYAPSTTSNPSPYSRSSVNDSSATLVATNSYATQSSNAPPYVDDESSGRSELFKGRTKFKPQVPARAQLPEASSDYDPSIMETEEERRQREGYSGANSYGDHFQSGHSYGDGSQGQSGSSASLYGGYQDQVQEEDETEINAIKDQMRYVKKESLTTAQNARRYAEQAEASGLRTLQMLGEQSDQIANSEGSIAVTENQTKLGEDYAKELHSLNRSMFAIHVSNPFNSRRRIQEQEQKIKQSFHNQQLIRESDRQTQYNSQQRIMQAMGNAPGERRRQLTETELRYREQMQKQKQSLAQTSKFQFEPDDEDFEVERDIDATLDDIGAASARLNSMAKSINTELESQNQRIERLNDKTQKVEIDVHLNTSRLARIR
ncbi:hypothetical protein V1514DRAFT_325256 [Lipomyces japonicus]|uniref:uncharacterized protein n=1 Tax=Lipomyces japonicus TaxID=56871 RepID=UPI0034D01CE9